MPMRAVQQRDEADEVREEFGGAALAAYLGVGRTDGEAWPGCQRVAE